MRILCSFVGGLGHLEPIAPIARAAMAAGHDVAFAADPSMVGAVEARGFTAFPAGARGSGGPPQRRPLVAPDVERELRVLRDVFAGRLTRERLPDLLAVVAAWQPDVVVCDETDFGAAIAAERLGIPHATVVIGATGTFLQPAMVAEPLAAVRAEHGLPPEGDGPALVLCPFPPGLRAAPLPPQGHALRLTAAPGTAPDWLQPLRDAIYFTLGTVVNLEAGDLFTRVLEGVREVGPDVIVTVGSGIDPAELGPQPAHVHAVQHVDQALVLPRCRVVVSHAGSGSILGALANGLPFVLLPISADQPVNARRCAELGVALELDVMTATPAAVRDAVTTVLTDPAYRSAAERLRDEIAALPGTASAIERLEALA